MPTTKQETQAKENPIVQVERHAAEEGSAAVVRNPHVRVVPFTDDEVLVTHGLRSTLTNILFDEKRQGVISRFVQSFETPATLEGALERISR